MKPTSIIFLALSVLLIIAGAITCGIANSKAADEGVAIFENELSASGDPIRTVDLEKENINKISITLENCNVEIVGNSEICEAELTNFEKYMYSLSTLDSELVLADGFGWKSLVELSSGGISFDGMRHLFPFGGKDRPEIEEGATRTVVIRIPSDQSIRKIDITLEKGDITFRDMTSKANITATTGEGNVSVSGKAETDTSYVLTTENGNITFDDPLCVGNSQLHTKSGDITIVTASENECEYKLDAPLGTVTYFGTSAGHAYHTSTTMTQKFTAISDTGNIIIGEPASEPTDAQ